MVWPAGGQSDTHAQSVKHTKGPGVGGEGCAMHGRHLYPRSLLQSGSCRQHCEKAHARLAGFRSAMAHDYWAAALTKGRGLSHMTWSVMNIAL